MFILHVSVAIFSSFVVILAVLLYAFVIVFRPFVVVSCLLLLILLPFLAFLKMF